MIHHRGHRALHPSHGTLRNTAVITQRVPKDMAWIQLVTFLETSEVLMLPTVISIQLTGSGLSSHVPPDSRHQTVRKSPGYVPHGHDATSFIEFSPLESVKLYGVRKSGAGRRGLIIRQTGPGSDTPTPLEINSIMKTDCPRVP